MEIFLLSLAVFAIVVSLMAVGVMLKRKPIRGSCGGIAVIMGTAGCDACDPTGRCTKRKDGIARQFDSEDRL